MYVYMYVCMYVCSYIGQVLLPIVHQLLHRGTSLSVAFVGHRDWMREGGEGIISLFMLS